MSTPSPSSSSGISISAGIGIGVGIVFAIVAIGLAVWKYRAVIEEERERKLHSLANELKKYFKLSYRSFKYGNGLSFVREINALKSCLNGRLPAFLLDGAGVSTFVRSELGPCIAQYVSVESSCCGCSRTFDVGGLRENMNVIADELLTREAEFEAARDNNDYDNENFSQQISLPISRHELPSLIQLPVSTTALLNTESKIPFHRNPLDTTPSRDAQLRVVIPNDTASSVAGALISSSHPSSASVSTSTFTKSSSSSSDCTSSINASAATSGLEAFDLSLLLPPEKLIGQGAFGKVYTYQYRFATVVVKKMAFTDEESLMAFIDECRIMQRVCKHPNVVSFLGANYVDPMNACIVMEYIDGGSVSEVLKNQFMERTDLPVVLMMIRDAAAGIFHLHSEGVRHRDIAARNLLFDRKTHRVRVCDLGMSRLKRTANDESKTDSNIGPFRWMAPEAIQDQIYSTASDVYMFASTVWEIFARKHPYPNISSGVKIMVGVTNGSLRPLLPPPTPTNDHPQCPGLLCDILHRCFHASEPNERPKMEELLSCIQNLINDAAAESTTDVKHATESVASSAEMQPYYGANYHAGSNYYVAK